MKNAILVVSFVLSLSAVPAMAAAPAGEPIKIGEMTSYAAFPDEGQKWQQGWRLALDEVNRQGGVMGRPLVIVSRDDKGNPAEAVKLMEAFKNLEDIKIVMGTIFSHVGLAASGYAKQNHMLMFRSYAGSPKFTAEAGHDLYFQIQPPIPVWSGILADKAAESGRKKWAFIAADYEFSRASIALFQDNLKRLNPDVSFVETQWFPIGKLDAGAVAQVVARAKPDGIFVVAFGGDYARLMREGTKRALFKDRLTIGPYAGNTGFIKPLGKEAPVGWLSCGGYPLDKIQGEDHKKFVNAFRAIYGDDPYIASFYAYSVVKILAKAMDGAGSDDPEKVAAYIKSHTFDVPGYTLSFRADGISSLGDWVGHTGFKNGVPTIIDPVYIKPDPYLPSVKDNMAQWTK